MFKNYFNNREGMAIPLVLIVSLVLVILGTTAISIGVADHRHSLFQNNKMQAFYLAKSGAQTMATYLIEKSYHASYTEMSQLLTNISDKTSDLVNIQNGTIKIQTIRRIENNQERLDIISTGTYGDMSETVTVTLLLLIQSESGDFNPSSLEKALVALSEDANNALQLTNGAFLEGDIFVNATKENSIRFSGGGYRIRNGSLFIPHNSNPHFVIQTDKGGNLSELPPEYSMDVPSNIRSGWNNNWAFWKDIQKSPNGVRNVAMPSFPSASFPEPVFPEFPSIDDLPEPNNTNFTTPWVQGEFYPITEDGYFNSIVPSSSRTVTIDMGFGDRIIRVRDLNLTGGNMELINVGANSKLYLYVDNSFSLGSSRTLNNNGLPENVQLYYAGTSQVTIDGSSRFSGNVFVKQADILLTAGGNMRGNIVTLGERVIVSGGSSAAPMNIYAPNALVQMAGSGQIRGSVVANSLIRTGGSNPGIIYAPVDYSIPGDFFGSTNNRIQVRYDINPWR